MSTVIVKNIDMKLLKKQKAQLPELINELEYRGLLQTADALNGIINLLDVITDAGEDNKSLEEPEVDLMLADLKVLLAVCGFNDMTTRAQDRALAKAIQFIEGKSFPVGGR